jgi:HEAT repeat protein
VLASLICDEESGLDAIQTIEAIGGDAAITVLILADCPPAADAIAEAVARLRNEAPYTAEETGLSEELLQLVLKPESCTDKAAAVAQCREALAGEELPRPSRCMVLRALVQLAGKEALPELIAAQSNTDPVYQGCGRELARSLSGEDVSQAWIFRLEEFDALSRAAVFALLGERGDASAQDAVLKALSDASPEIRLAACRAIDATFGDKALPPLLDAFDQSEETAELQALKEALLRLPKLEEAVLNLMTPDALLDDSMSADKKSICLDIITERAATQFRDFVIDNLEDSDAKVRRSAYSALAVIGDETNIDQFFNSIVNEKRDAEAEAAAAALVSLAKRLDQQDATINQAATLLEKAEDGVALRLIRMLSTFNSANAVAPAKAMLDKRVNDEGTDSKWLRNALEILAVWQQEDARLALLDLWKNTEAADRRKTALKCYTTSVERSLSDQDAQIQALRDAKEFASDDREKRSLDDAEKKLRGKK